MTDIDIETFREFAKRIKERREVVEQAAEEES